MRDVFSDLHLLVLTLALNWVIGAYIYIHMYMCVSDWVGWVRRKGM